MSAPWLKLSRRDVLRSAAGLAGVATLGGLTACGSDAPVRSSATAVARAEAARRRPGQRLVTARLTPRPVTIDLGGVAVDTWAYGAELPGPVLRAAAGDLLRIDVDNQLPVGTSVHWHGLALSNDMDGVPGITQSPIAAGDSLRYEFTAPDPGTYFYHPHSGVQLDRGLYGVLVIDDPDEPGDYDVEWIVVLDDWVDGTGRTPDDVLAALQAASDGSSDGMDSMSGMDHGSMMGGMGGMQSPILGGAGDVTYPHYLVNGRTATDPQAFTAAPGTRVRIRIVNAGSDTAFRVAIGGHRMTITHSDGFPVTPTSTDALLIGMGERFDVSVTLGDGVFSLIASAEGKDGQGLAIVRTGAGTLPTADIAVPELSGQVLLGTDLAAAEAARIETRPIERRHDVILSGSMAPYRWMINGSTFGDTSVLPVSQGERVSLRFVNRSMMFHPMHVHGHTFALAADGARKDTVIVRPMQALEVELDADNPGQWAAHCHNVYHAEAGMMTIMSYRS